MNKTPTTLIIMDGFGLRTETEGNAVAAANTPRLDQFFQEYAHTELSASGLDVGLPAGQMGNSEVGHTNIGGGTITANYDGVHKHHTTIGSNVHVGAGNLFVAPVTVGDGVTTEDGIHLVVEKLDKNRIESVHLYLPEPKPEDEEGDED